VFVSNMYNRRRELLLYIAGLIVIIASSACSQSSNTQPGIDYKTFCSEHGRPRIISFTEGACMGKPLRIAPSHFAVHGQALTTSPVI